MTEVKLGVAFAGGGVRGCSHLGIMQALHENRIYPTIYAGTSAGSIVASLLACEYTPNKALEKFEGISKGMIDIAYGHILKGILTKSYIEGFVAGDRLEELLEELFKGSYMSKVYAPLGIVATDINKGKQVVFSNVPIDTTKVIDVDAHCLSGDAFGGFKLSEVVRASSSMPPVFVPKVIKGMKLVDGGITNNLPSDIAVALGADKVISIDLGYAGEVETNGIIDIAHESINLLMKRVTDGNRNDFGLYLNPAIYDVTALDTHRISECFSRGYEYGLSQIDNIVRYLEEEK